MKKLFICLSVVFIIFVIYLCTMDKKVYYLALGDSSKYSYDAFGEKVQGYSYYVADHFRKKDILEKYVFEYSLPDLRITDLINDINSNKRYDNYTLKNSLIKADLVTLKIDASDVYSRIMVGDYNSVYDYIDGLSKDFSKLLELVRQYCKEDIIFIGYSNPFASMNNSDIDDLIDYLNKKYKEVCDEYEVIFNDISAIDFDGEYNGLMYFNGDDYKKIGDVVIKSANKSLFEG